MVGERVFGPGFEHDLDRLVEVGLCPVWIKVRRAIDLPEHFGFAGSAAAPDAIFITIPDGVARKNKEAGGGYTYTAVFSHDGRKLGESLETCPGDKPKACADQMAADARSAAALP